MNSRKIRVLFLGGLLVLFGLTRSPRFAGSHAVVVLQLVALGICFGVALMAVLGRLKPKRSGRKGARGFAETP